MAIRLILFQNDQKLAVDIGDGTCVLGRDEPADIVVPNASVSRRHAELQVSGSRCTIRDMGSSNGTTVNGIRISGAHAIGPSDEIRLGSARIGIEIGSRGRGSVENPTVHMPASRGESSRAPFAAAASPQPLVRSQWRTPSWAVSISIAALMSIAVLVLLMMLVGWYWTTSARRAQTTASFVALAAQYVHLMHPRLTEPLPRPIVNQYLAEPVMILDPDGRVLYPSVPGGEPPASPWIDNGKGRVPDAAKTGMYRFGMPAVRGPAMRAASFPIAHGGDVLGYVVAQPVDRESDFLPILSMILCAAAISLLVHYFAVRPVTSSVRREVDLLREKVTALAHGFADSLPRSMRMPELSALAAEVEVALRAHKQGESTLRPAQAGKGEYSKLCSTLLDAAHVPYCFIDSNFNLLASNADFGSFREFESSRRGKSIFDSDLPSLDSKQLVRAISDARTGSESSAKVTLTRNNQSKEYIVHVKRLADEQTDEPMYGLLFES